SQVTGDSAKFTSALIGNILQEHSTLITNNRGTSVSQSLQLDLALPASKIASLSAGEFARITADSPDQPMPLKAFHCQIKLDPQPSQDFPRPSIKVSKETLTQIFQQTQEEAKRIVENRL